MSDATKELEAMKSIAAILDGLESDEARLRVLQWAVGIYGRGAPTVAGKARGSLTQEVFGEPQDFAALFDAANPQIAEEKALIAGYWFQFREGNTDLDAQTLNTALKDLGHGIGNITVALGGLERRDPALVRQIKKSGKTKQARKKYRVTTAGKRAAESMLAGARLGEE